jgi:hypothetical protein
MENFVNFQCIYSFGTPSGDFYGFFKFEPDGTIKGYHNTNENTYVVDGNELLFISIDGVITSRFRYCHSSESWFGNVENRAFPLFICPLLKIDPPAGKHFEKSFLVNSVPKSGTYYTEKALEMIGIYPTRLHLLDENIVLDWRDKRDDEIHVLDSMAFNCPHGLIASLLKGQQLVGHLSSVASLQEIKKEGVIILNLVRNLRNQLISNLIAIKEKKIPVSEFESKLLKMPLKESIISYYSYIYGKISMDPSLDLTKKIIENITTDPSSITIKYEDALVGKIGTEAYERLNAECEGFSEKLENAYISARDTKTPTLSKTRSNWEEIWDDNLELLFEASGLKQLNEMLGYS